MIYLISAVLGLALGSFANVCIVRLPHDKSIWTPRSRCPRCGKPLKAWHNVPLVSFILLKGHCAHCRAPISWQYPLVEGTMAFLFLFHAYLFRGFLPQILVADILAFYLLTITVIDYRHRIIPDELSLSLALVGLLGAGANPYLSGPVWMKYSASAGSALIGGSAMLGMG